MDFYTAQRIIDARIRHLSWDGMEAESFTGQEVIRLTTLRDRLEVAAIKEIERQLDLHLGEGESA